MRIGPITIRWTKDIAKEQHKREWKRKLDSSLIALQVVEIVKLKAIIHRWGIGGASGKAKTPSGVGASI